MKLQVGDSNAGVLAWILQSFKNTLFIEHLQATGFVMNRYWNQQLANERIPGS